MTGLALGVHWPIRCLSPTEEWMNNTSHVQLGIIDTLKNRVTSTNPSSGTREETQIDAWNKP